MAPFLRGHFVHGPSLIKIAGQIKFLILKLKVGWNNDESRFESWEKVNLEINIQYLG